MNSRIYKKTLAKFNGIPAERAGCLPYLQQFFSVPVSCEFFERLATSAVPGDVTVAAGMPGTPFNGALLSPEGPEGPGQAVYIDEIEKALARFKD